MAQLTPTRPNHYEEMSIYYDHIKDVFLDKNKYKAVRESYTVEFLKYLAFVCVLPVIPAAGIYLWVGTQGFHGGGLRHNFLPAWILSALVSATWFAVERKKQEARTLKGFRERFLAGDQARF